MRDSGDTCITICNMENIDPMGVHTGESIVVTPSQTLSDVKHQMLRSASIRILSLIHISEPTRQAEISYAVFCLKKKRRTPNSTTLYSSAASAVYTRQVDRRASFTDTI